MAADPTLADRLDEDAKWLDRRSTTKGTNARARRVAAAAVRLRKLDAIEDPEALVALIVDRIANELRVQSGVHGGDNRPFSLLAESIAWRIADALGGTE